MKSLSMLLVVLLVAASAHRLEAQNGHDLFQQALVKERSNGQIQEAIRIYERIVAEFSTDRALAARALVRLGRAHESLGSRQARETYQRVVTDFADQADMVTEARARLTALEARDAADLSAGPITQLLLTGEDMDATNFLDMWPSPDGRMVAYTRITTDGALMIRNMETGDTTVLRDESRNWHPVWSPDARRLAYQARYPRSARGQRIGLEVFDLASRTVTSPRGLSDVALVPLDWSPDGVYLACAQTNEDSTMSIVLVTVSTGERRELVRQPVGEPVRADFSPDSRYLAYTGRENGNQDIQVTELGTGRRSRITSTAEVDRAPFWSPDGETLVYQNRDGAWAVAMADGRATSAPRLIGDEPVRFPAGWTSDGGFYFMRDHTVQLAYRILVDPQTGRARGEPERLPIELTRPNSGFVSSPDMRQIAFISIPEDRQQLHVYSVDEQRITSYQMAGRGPISGLNLWWSSDGREVRFVPGAPGTNDLTVRALDPGTGSARDLFPPLDSTSRLRLSSDGGQMLSYQGRRGQRRLVVSQTGNRTGRIVASEPHPAGRLTSWTRPQFSPDGSQILFGRQQSPNEDGSSSLWVVSAEGGEPRRLVAATYLTHAQWDPTGRMIAYTWNAEDRARLSVVTLATGATHEIELPDGFGGREVQEWSSDGRWLGVLSERGGWQYWVTHDLLGEDSGRQPRR